MNPSNWWTLKILFGATAAVFALLAAFCTFVDTLKGEKQERIQGWFQRRWAAIESSRWQSLPEGVIKWLIELKSNLGKYLEDLFEDHILTVVAVLSLTPFLLGIARFIHRGIDAAVAAFLVFSCPILLVLLSFEVSFHEPPLAFLPSLLRTPLLKFLSSREFMPLFWLIIPFCICGGLLPMFFIVFALDQNIFVGSAIVIVLVPLLAGNIYALFWAMYTLIKKITGPDFDVPKGPNILPLAFALIVSCAVTFLALLLGHLAKPDAWIPQTLEMVVSNVVFDGATFMATIWLLSWAIKRRPLLRIPIAVVADIGLGIVFACASLYIGLRESTGIRTPHPLSLGGVLNVLIAKSPDGTAFEIGPYFWAMHTAFLPTIVYLGIIVIGWIGKALLIPAGWFFGAGQHHKNPLRLTAALFGIFVALFGVLALAAGAAQDYAKEKQAAPVAHQKAIKRYYDIAFYHDNQAFLKLDCLGWRQLTTQTERSPRAFQGSEPRKTQPIIALHPKPLPAVYEPYCLSWRISPSSSGLRGPPGLG